MTNEYEIGYGKPPKSSQWKKGESGNSKGRPKQKPEYIVDYARILSEPVKARQSDGSTVTLDSAEAAYVQLCKKALKGDNASLFQAIKIMLDILPNGMKIENDHYDETADAKERFRIMAGWSENWSSKLK